MDILINQFKLEHVREAKEDLKFDQFCSVMDKMNHPFVIYKENIISPWDVCVTLLSEDLPVTSFGTKFQKIRTCPHCKKKEID